MEKKSYPTKQFKTFLRFLKDNNAYTSFFNNIKEGYSSETIYDLIEATRIDFYSYFLHRMFFSDIKLDKKTNRYISIFVSVDSLVDWVFLYDKWLAKCIIKKMEINKAKNKPQAWFNNYSKPVSYKR